MDIQLDKLWSDLDNYDNNYYTCVIEPKINELKNRKKMLELLIPKEQINKTLWQKFKGYSFYFNLVFWVLISILIIIFVFFPNWFYGRHFVVEPKVIDIDSSSNEIEFAIIHHEPFPNLTPDTNYDISYNTNYFCPYDKTTTGTDGRSSWPLWIVIALVGLTLMALALGFAFGENSEGSTFLLVAVAILILLFIKYTSIDPVKFTKTTITMTKQEKINIDKDVVVTVKSGKDTITVNIKPKKKIINAQSTTNSQTTRNLQVQTRKSQTPESFQSTTNSQTTGSSNTFTPTINYSTNDSGEIIIEVKLPNTKLNTFDPTFTIKSGDCVANSTSVDEQDNNVIIEANITHLEDCVNSDKFMTIPKESIQINGTPNENEIKIAIPPPPPSN